MIKALFSDIDGTILDNSKSISESTLEAFTLLTKKGIDVFLATGRMYASAHDISKGLNISSPIVACNGSLIKHPIQDTLIFARSFTPKDFEEAIFNIESLGLYYYFYSEDTLYCKTISPYVLSLISSSSSKLNVIELGDSLENVIKMAKINQIFKLVMLDKDNNHRINAMNRLKTLGLFSIDSSTSLNIEVMPNGVNKGFGVKVLMDYLGLDKDECACIGDNHNDISMFSQCGLSIAMGDADKSVKGKASYVTKCINEDGYLHAVKSLVNGEI